MPSHSKTSPEPAKPMRTSNSRPQNTTSSDSFSAWALFRQLGTDVSFVLGTVLCIIGVTNVHPYPWLLVTRDITLSCYTLLLECPHTPYLYFSVIISSKPACRSERSMLTASCWEWNQRRLFWEAVLIVPQKGYPVSRDPTLNYTSKRGYFSFQF